MSFGGGGSGASAVTAHIHSTAAGEGGNLVANNSTSTGTALNINSTVYPIEVLL
tara:strand:+ start:748 stop:909 length:162 start_codon:yes stop_codon:yes gene_type:complete